MADRPIIKGRPIITLPPGENMWDASPKAEDRIKLAKELIRKCNTLAKEVPKGWKVEIFG